jgi:predicted small lipoprotein YifL
MSAARRENPGIAPLTWAAGVGGSELKFSLVLARRKHVMQAAVLACLLATLGLSACGRKGGLDAPPGASVVNQAPQSVPELTPEDQPAQTAPPAPPPPTRTWLDWLID